MSSVFGVLPDNFFSPLSSPNRRHYAELLLIYYRLFLEYTGGVEREIVMARFEEYFSLTGKNVEREADETSPEREENEPEPRFLAALFLRKLLGYGWMNEEERLDFSRVVNLSSWAKPFFEALEKVSQGLSVEYESHIIAVYSSLCGDAVKDNGQHAVLNAHYHTRLLVESLKILEQNIRSFIQGMYQEDAEISEILHAHYDVYMHEVVDKAYTRLKTSDNLSRYRPKIVSSVGTLLKDAPWLEKTAAKLAVIRRVSTEDAKRQLKIMLQEIRDDLKSIDPLLEDIDDKNRRYSRISTERIKARLYTDTTLQGKSASIIKAWQTLPELPSELGFESLGHRIIRQRYLEGTSLYYRKTRVIPEDSLVRPEQDDFEVRFAETEIRLRLAGQLNPVKIGGFLGRFCSRPGVPEPAESMVEDMDSFVKIMYAALYAESRGSGFPFSVAWQEGETVKDRFRFRRHTFSRRYTDG